MTPKQQEGLLEMMSVMVMGNIKNSTVKTKGNQVAPERSESQDMSVPSTSIKPTGSNKMQSNNNVRGV